MNTDDAVYHTVHDYPGGCESLGPRVGISPKVLQNKANPTQDTHKMGLKEAIRIQAITGDVRILHAMADELDHVAIPCGQFNGVSDQALLDLFNREYAALGKFSEHFSRFFADGGITSGERDLLAADVYSIKKVLAEIMARINVLADQTASRAARKGGK